MLAAFRVARAPFLRDRIPVSRGFGLIGAARDLVLRELSLIVGDRGRRLCARNWRGHQHARGEQANQTELARTVAHVCLLSAIFVDSTTSEKKRAANAARRET
jgi:hypothetical protein